MLITFLVVLAFAVSNSYGINWNGNWAPGCDWVGNDLSNATTKGEDCGGKCATTSLCTHFTWTNYLGGTCFLKKNHVTKSDAIASSDPSAVCGIMESNGGGSPPPPSGKQT